MTATIVSAPPAGAVYDTVLAHAAAGRPAVLTVLDDQGRSARVDAAAWCRDALPGDRALLRRVDGPALDVGCGPGRLTAALARQGRPALGIDVSGTAVRLARRRGAAALRRDVFAALPGTRRWRHLLLADGNIGIGGDPGRLLRRCAELLAPDGRLHAELAAPGTPGWAGTARLRHGDGPPSRPFPWATVAADGLDGLAADAGLRVCDTWAEGNRWFATMSGTG
jgi:SAM-dependent methyltransferase